MQRLEMAARCEFNHMRIHIIRNDGQSEKCSENAYDMIKYKSQPLLIAHLTSVAKKHFFLRMRNFCAICSSAIAILKIAPQLRNYRAPMATASATIASSFYVVHSTITIQKFSDIGLLWPKCYFPKNFPIFFNENKIGRVGKISRGNSDESGHEIYIQKKFALPGWSWS